MKNNFKAQFFITLEIIGVCFPNEALNSNLKIGTGRKSRNFVCSADLCVNCFITRSISQDHNNIVSKSLVMGDLQSMFEKFLQTCQDDWEQDKLKFKFLAGKIQELPARTLPGRSLLKEAARRTTSSHAISVRQVPPCTNCTRKKIPSPTVQ